MNLHKKISQLENDLSRLEGLHSRKEDIYWSRSDEWQESEKGDAYYTYLSDLEYAIDAYDELIKALETVVNG